MQAVLEFLAVVSVAIGPAIYGSVLASLKPNNFNNLSAYDLLFRRFFYSAACIMLVLLIAILAPDGLASVGINIQDAPRNAQAIFAGLILLGILQLMLRYGLYLLQPKTPNSIDFNRPHISETILYKTLGQRLLFIVVIALGVVAEELVFRGYLVLMLSGQNLTLILIWAAVSVALSVLAHLYQGISLNVVIVHAVLSAGFITAAVTTQNIAAAIAPHLLMNIVFEFRVWNAFDARPAQQSTPPLTTSSHDEDGYHNPNQQ